MTFHCEFCDMETDYPAGWLAQWFAMLQDTIGCPEYGNITILRKDECLIYTNLIWSN